MGFFQSLFRMFLSPLGLVALAAMDSSMLFFSPMAVEAAIIVLSSRNPSLFWMFPLLATAGSLIGTSATFWVGRKIGEKGLVHWISSSRLASVQRKIKNKGAMALALPGLLPPPFPFTPLVLVFGAVSGRAGRFFLTLAVVRLFRFIVVAFLGWRYGRQILTVFESENFEMVGYVFLLIVLLGTTLTIYRLFASARRHGIQP